MNIVRIREEAKEMHKAKLIDSAALHKILHAPVFIYPERKEPLNPDETEWYKENIGAGEDHQVPMKLPFSTLILSTNIGGEALTIYVMREPTTYETQLGTKSVMLNIIGACGKKNRMWWRGGYTGTMKEGIVCDLTIDGKSVYIKTEEQLRIAKTNMNHICAQVQMFAFDVMSNFSTTLKCSPKPTPGKSVEWHLSRTHYCIVARKQAEEFRASKRGPSSAEIIRAAGWRRAHFRTLSALRFTHKRGMRVPVKQAWVGPSEWEGLDGKIYKVVQ